MLHKISNSPHRLAGSKACPTRRQGVVLLAVLIVVVLLSLAAYNYSDLMTAQYKASDNYHKNAQARAYADSGIHYAMAILTNPDNIANLLNNNPYDNSTLFQNHAVTQGNATGYFTFLAPLSANNTGGTGICQFGFIDESGKININAMMANDPTGSQLYQMLLLLPNMTDDIANSIIDWVDIDTTPRQGGAENDYYNTLTPPYNAKNGPLDSLEELLLVKGVTPQLLFGSDLNRNGYQDPTEMDDGTVTSTGFDRGWSAYLTIYSREQNVDPTGLALINLNDTTVDLPTMFSSLSSVLGNDLATFIIMARQLGMSSPAPAPPPGPGNKTQAGVLANYKLDTTKPAKNQIKSLYDLISGTVSIKTQTGNGKNMTTVTTVYKSPLNDPSQQATLLPMLFQTVTVFPATEIPARINVNTASLEVLTALTGVQGGITTADVQAIVAAQPVYSSADPPDDSYLTPAWLITKANINPSKLSKMEPMITTRSQVYRVQSLGYFDQNKGPVVRIEAVIDANLVSVAGALVGQPRILAWRDLSDFGKVRPPQQ